MEVSNKIKGYDGLLNHMIDVICEPLDEDTEALREALKEEGYDYDELTEKGKEFAKALLEKMNRKGKIQKDCNNCKYERINGLLLPCIECSQINLNKTEDSWESINEKRNETAD